MTGVNLYGCFLSSLIIIKSISFQSHAYYRIIIMSIFANLFLFAMVPTNCIVLCLCMHTISLWEKYIGLLHVITLVLWSQSVSTYACYFKTAIRIFTLYYTREIHNEITQLESHFVCKILYRLLSLLARKLCLS